MVSCVKGDRRKRSLNIYDFTIGIKVTINGFHCIGKGAETEPL